MPTVIRPMTLEEFEIFYQFSIEQHTAELMEELHISRETALQAARKEVAEMLPQGLLTEHHHLMTVAESDSKETAGFIWTIHEETNGRKQSFICDFAICERKRRKGIGTEALYLAEKHATEAGCRESVLFVADRNHAARTLYEKCGYQVLRQERYGKYMVKRLF